MLPLPESYVSSICEVKTMENELVATGVISEITPEYIQIRDKSDTMSLVNFGTMVKINVFNFRQGFRVLVGKVYLSTLKFIRVVEISSLLDYERRNFFRVETKLHATLEHTDGAGEPLTVSVRDLSLGGAMFTAEEEAYEIGQELLMKIKLGHLNTSLHCVVRRAAPDEGAPDQLRYGVEFYNVTDVQNGALCAYVFQRQREQINKFKA